MITRDAFPSFWLLLFTTCSVKVAVPTDNPETLTSVDWRFGEPTATPGVLLVTTTFRFRSVFPRLSWSVIANALVNPRTTEKL